jgi:hypothetical protein
MKTKLWGRVQVIQDSNDAVTIGDNVFLTK